MLIQRSTPAANSLTGIKKIGSSRIMASQNFHMLLNMIGWVLVSGISCGWKFQCSYSYLIWKTDNSVQKIAAQCSPPQNLWIDTCCAFTCILSLLLINYLYINCQICVLEKRCLKDQTWARPAVVTTAMEHAAKSAAVLSYNSYIHWNWTCLVLLSVIMT